VCVSMCTCVYMYTHIHACMFMRVGDFKDRNMLIKDAKRFYEIGLCSQNMTSPMRRPTIAIFN
jgi:hypothetical protein